jgi:hypothetical protein
MLLYHGTSKKLVDDILKEGLKPRGEDKGNWYVNNIPSHPDLIYLTDQKWLTYFYALNCAVNTMSNGGCLLTIDTEFLDEDKFRIDENYYTEIELDRTNATNKAVPFEIRYDQLDRIASDKRWKESLSVCNACSFKGVIPPTAIISTDYVDNEWNPLFRKEFVASSDVEANLATIKVVLDTTGVFINTNTGECCWEDRIST